MFMEEWKKKIGNDYARLSRMSIVEEGSVKVCVRPKMASSHLFGNLWNTLFDSKSDMSYSFRLAEYPCSKSINCLLPYSQWCLQSSFRNNQIKSI